MNEIGLAPGEKQTKQVSSTEVLSAYQRFQQEAGNGFPSHEAQLDMYQATLRKAADFFKRKDLISSSTEVKQVIDTLFLPIVQQGTVPIDFFLTTGDRLREVRVDQKQQIAIVKDLLKEELVATSQALQVERGARIRLENLASEASTEPLPEKTERDTNQLVKQAIIMSLEKDAELGPQIKKIAQYKQVVTSLAKETKMTDSASLEKRLEPFQDLLGETTSGVSVFEDITLHNFIGDTEYTKRVLKGLATQTTKRDFVWDQLLAQTAFPSELYHSLNELTVLTELFQEAKLLEGLPKEQKAQRLLPYLEKGMNAVLLCEMAESRFSLPDDFIVQQVETFIDFSRKYDEEVFSQKNFKVTGPVAKILAATLATIALILPIAQQTNSMLDSGKADKVIENVVLEDPKDIIQTTTEESETSRYVSSDIHHPETHLPSEFKKGQGQIIWDLAGKELKGFYRTGAAEEFDEKKRAWIVNRRVVSGPLLRESLSQASITFSGEQLIGPNGIVELPQRVGYALAKNSVKVEQAAFLRNFSIEQTTDGSYYIQFNRKDADQVVNISYGLGKIDGSTVNKPTQQELQKMNKTPISIEDLPEGELKTFMEALRSSNKSQAVKAKALEKYIKKNFLYSLDAGVSAYYDLQKDAKEYFKQIAQRQKGDCDVINSLYVMLLRAQGIPARLVLGFANTGGFIDNNKKALTNTEGHGWAEAYVNGGFLQLDATPTELDEYTKEAMKGRGDPTLSFDLSDLSSLESALSTEAFYTTLLSLLGGNLLLFGGRFLLRRRNKELLTRLEQSRDQRTAQYLGETYAALKYDLSTLDPNLQDLYPKDINPFSLLPPLAISGVVREVVQAYKLAKISYAGDRNIAAATSPPDITHYFQKVLGYEDMERTDVTEMLVTKAFQKNISSIDNTIEMIGYHIGKGLRKPELFVKFLQHTLGQIKPPQTAEEWEASKAATTNAVYENTGNFHLAVGEKFYYPKEALEINLEEAYRLQLMKWKASQEYTEYQRSKKNESA